MKKIFAVLLCVLTLTFAASCGTRKVQSIVPEKEHSTESAVTPSADAALDTYTQTDVPAPAQTEFTLGETWMVDGQWELTVTGVSETDDRNEFSDKKPAAVYIVNFTWKNIGYSDRSGIMDGLYLVLDDSIIDNQGFMGYSYPGEITDYPQETPIGASCNGQVCIGVDNAGLPIRINVIQYDGNGEKQTATFVLE